MPYGGIAPPIFNFTIGWRWALSFTIQPFYTQKGSPTPVS